MRCARAVRSVALMGRRRQKTGFFRDEHGITTVGMAVALFVSIALIFSGAQAYRVHSASAGIQEVADACALAADDEVAGLEAVANTCDAACLSLTLLSATLYGLGLVAACVPPAEGVSVKLIEWGQKAAQARDRFYERACTGLNVAQRALPFLALCNAMRVARANDGGAMGAEHVAAAVLVPQGFTELGGGIDDGLDEAATAIDGEAPGIRERAAEAERAAEEANAAKERGFMEDCGADPAYCMRERASSLAGLADAANPSYASVDAWSFSVALERARAYYQKRLSSWNLEGASVEAQADSVIRKRFYRYAIDELADAYVHDGPEGFSASIPHLFRNTDEMRSTELYAEAVYPVTVRDGIQTMHAWSGCPHAGGAVRMGSVSELEAQRSSFSTCPLCEFVPSSVGSVAAASTSISNGFENHYEAMRQACEAYEAAHAKADPLAAEVRDRVTPLLDAMGEVLAKADAHRIHMEPPGRNGALAMVVNVSEARADAGLESAFVTGGAALGARAAVSAAALVEDGTESAGAMVTGTLSALFPGDGGIGGAASAAAGAWMSLLRAYEDGQAALEDAVSDGLGSFSQNSASGLGAWAAQALSDVISAAGLEPADTGCRKPQVLNTGHVASSDGSSVCVSFMKAKDAALAGSSPSTSALGSVVEAAGRAGPDAPWSESLDIAEIELPFGSQKLSWAIPKASGDEAGILEVAAGVLASAVEGFAGERSWR